MSGPISSVDERGKVINPQGWEELRVSPLILSWDEAVHPLKGERDLAEGVALMCWVTHSDPEIRAPVCCCPLSLPLASLQIVEEETRCSNSRCPIHEGGPQEYSEMIICPVQCTPWHCQPGPGLPSREWPRVSTTPFFCDRSRGWSTEVSLGVMQEN